MEPKSGRISVPLSLEGRLSEPDSLRGVLSDPSALTGTLAIADHISGEEYEGSYEVSPKLSEQILDTQGKTLSQNVSIRKIPVMINDNLYNGLTVLIG